MNIDQQLKIKTSHLNALSKALEKLVQVAPVMENDYTYRVGSTSKPGKNYTVILDQETGLVNSKCTCSVFGQDGCVHRGGAFYAWLSDKPEILKQITERLDKGWEVVPTLTDEDKTQAEDFWTDLLLHYELTTEALKLLGSQPVEQTTIEPEKVQPVTVKPKRFTTSIFK